VNIDAGYSWRKILTRVWGIYHTDTVLIVISYHFFVMNFHCMMTFANGQPMGKYCGYLFMVVFKTGCNHLTEQLD
jgi:hypothetical protein